MKDPAPISTKKALVGRRLGAIPRGVATAAPIVVDHARNALLWDVEGESYIDFAAGIAALNTGHLHPKVIAAAQAQVDKLTHAAFQVTAYEPHIVLA